MGRNRKKGEAMADTSKNTQQEVEEENPEAAEQGASQEPEVNDVPEVVVPRQTKRLMAEVELTEEELLTAGTELSDALEEMSRLEVQKKNLSDQKKNEIDAQKARATELSRKIQSKVEHREFFCEAEFDWVNHVKKWKSVNDGVVRATETISPQDCQMKMRLEEEQHEEADEQNSVPDYSAEDAANDGHGADGEEEPELVGDAVPEPA
jgi:hypothetical protein